MNNKIKILIYAVFLFVSIIMIYTVFRNSIDLTNKVNFTPLIFTIGFIATLFGLVFTLSSFLDSTKSSSQLMYEVKKNKIRERNYIEELLKDKNNKQNNLPVSKENNKRDLEEITDLIRNRIESISAEKYFQEFKQKVKVETVVEILENKTKSIESRVQREIGRLSKSGIINLSLGMMLSIGGILYLGSFVVNVQTFDSLEKMFINTFPKTIFVLLIEVFAYFFLKLYKQNLDDIKYYQNELTNIESKNLAVQISKQSNNYKLLTLCVEEFLGTERNFILEKDQSTIEIEKERINSNNNNNLLMALKDIVKPK